MVKLAIDLLNLITLDLDFRGSSPNQELVISKEGFEELKVWAKSVDDTPDFILGGRNITNHVHILPYLKKENPEFPFNGYIFKLDIRD